MKKQKSQHGFSLIEIMITVAIIGIIAAIAAPHYGTYVTKSRRTDGMSELTRVMQQQEKYYLNAMTYVTDLNLLGFAATAGSLSSEQGHYEVRASACTGSTISRCVLLTAVPVDSQAGDGNLTINSRGERNWEGNDAGRSGWPT